MIRSPSPDDLKRRYAQWATEDLVEAVTFEAGGYVPGAVAVMRNVLDARNVSESESLRIQSDIQAEREAEATRLGRIRGWLVVFIVLVAVSSLFDLLLGFVIVGGSGSSLLMGLLVGGAGAFGGYVTFSLIRRQPAAPAYAQAWIVMTLCIDLILTGPSGNLLGSVLSALIWVWYLEESKRVAHVYGTDRYGSCVQPSLDLA